MEFCSKHEEFCVEIKYEDFVRSPETFVTQFEESYRLEATEITSQHIKSMGTHKLSRYPSIYKDIEEPERSKFLNLMEKLGYLV